MPRCMSYPSGGGASEFWVCPHVSRESNVRNNVGCKKIVDVIRIRVEWGLQRSPECIVHHCRKWFRAQIHQWPRESSNRLLNRSACIQQQQIWYIELNLLDDYPVMNCTYFEVTVNLRWPNSWNANCVIMSLTSGLRSAFLAPIGGGPPMVRFGARLSSPRPKAPQEKNSASMYSKFKGNSRRSMSDFGMFLWRLPTESSNSKAEEPWNSRRRRRTVVEAVEVDRAMLVLCFCSV